MQLPLQGSADVVPPEVNPQSLLATFPSSTDVDFSMGSHLAHSSLHLLRPRRHRWTRSLQGALYAAPLSFSTFALLSLLLPEIGRAAEGRLATFPAFSSPIQCARDGAQHPLAIVRVQSRTGCLQRNVGQPLVFDPLSFLDERHERLCCTYYSNVLGPVMYYFWRYYYILD